MFNILVGTRTLTKNYQTFKKNILEQWMRFLGFLPLFYLSFWGFQNSLSSNFQNLNMMHTWASLEHYQQLGMWQLTPTKQESRLEIQA